MGYGTRFEGCFTLDHPLAPAHAAYLAAFADTRRVKRDAALTAERPDPVRAAVGLAVGPDGGYFVGAAGDLGQEPGAPDVVDYNEPPGGQPHLWCCWRPTADGGGLHVEDHGYHYGYVPWLKLLEAQFLRPWGYALSGEVGYQGDHERDHGVIVATSAGIQRRPAGGPTINGNGYGKYERGMFLRAMGEAEKAFMAFAYAAAWSPEWSEAIWQHGIAFGQAGEAEEAFVLLDRAIALEPDPAQRDTMINTLARIKNPVQAP